MKNRLVASLLVVLSTGLIFTGCKSNKDDKTEVSIPESSSISVEEVEEVEEEEVEEEKLYNISFTIEGANETGPISGAEVRIKYDNLIEGCVTSDDGSVTFTNLEPRDYEIECSADGFYDRKFEIKITDEDKKYVIGLVPEISNDDAMVLLTWRGDQDVDLCAFNSTVKEYVNIGHPIDSEENVFLYADHDASQPYELIYIHNASDEVARTFYVTEAKNAREGATSKMEEDGVSVSVYNNKGLIFYTVAPNTQNAPLWIPFYLYAGDVYEQNDFVLDATGDDYNWISYNEKDAYTETN